MGLNEGFGVVVKLFRLLIPAPGLLSDTKYITGLHWAVKATTGSALLAMQLGGAAVKMAGFTATAVDMAVKIEQLCREAKFYVSYAMFILLYLILNDCLCVML